MKPIHPAKNTRIKVREKRADFRLKKSITRFLPINLICIGLIRLYQWTLSPLLGQSCRFYPSCSQYTLEAVKKHGALKGCWLGVKRIAKCGPWHKGGVDQIN